MTFSILNVLARQNLIAQKNDLQYQMLQNSSARRGMLNNLSFGSDLSQVAAYEAGLDSEQITNESQLMAINAELNALRSYSSADNRLNYFA